MLNFLVKMLFCALEMKFRHLELVCLRVKKRTFPLHLYRLARPACVYKTLKYPVK